VTDEDRKLVSAWVDAARNSNITDELESVYESVRVEIETRSPACWASGRCCNFDKTTHLLYVTGLEAAYTLTRLPADQTISTADVQTAREGGGCPFQKLNLCGVHTIKPLGCRTFFCDRSSTEWQHVLTERSLDRIKALHERFDVPYRYGEWRQMLATIIDAGPTSGG